jgi:D-cysteine desulfhydrase
MLSGKRTMSVSSAGRIIWPGSLELANLPTPLRPLEQLSEKYGREILCKRDDLTGSALSGNKVRKLEFLLGQALDDQATSVITCGGAQSNHARATALAAARLGLSCTLFLRTEDPQNPPATIGNLFLDRLAGAEVAWITPQQYAKRDQLMETRADEIARQGGKAFLIPEGGSNEVGSWGYVRCAQELAEQLGGRPATIVYAVGSGGTAAGLIAGCRLLDLPYRLIGICVADDRPTFQHRISSILSAMATRYAIDVEVEPEGIEIWEGYVGRGYALSQPEELRCIVDVARGEGIVLDPVYTGKAMYGLLNELQQGAARAKKLSDPIIFLHTGGIFGLFDKADELLPQL